MTGGQWESMESWHLFGCSKSALTPLKGRVSRLGENCWRPSEWWSEISNYIRCLLKEQQMRPCGFSNPLGNTAKWKQNHLEPFPRTVWSLGRKDDLLKIASCLWRARVCRIFLCWRPGFNHCHSQEKGSHPHCSLFYIREMSFEFTVKTLGDKVPVLFLGL